MPPTILITGCSSGFGRATAELFAARGWNVVATMRNLDDAGELERRPNVLATTLDVQDQESIGHAVDAAVGRFGRIDALVNNAGFGLFGVFESTSDDKVREQFEVNLFGAMAVTRAVLPHMRRRRAGTIVNVSSGAGVFGLPMLSLYCASKFALEGFSEALSYELAALGITVKLVEPGGVLETGFGARSGREAGATEPIADYADFGAAAARVFEGLRQQRLSSTEDVAEVIFGAVTDASPRLRYVATEDIRPLVEARRGGSDDAFMAMMRARFGAA